MIKHIIGAAMLAWLALATPAQAEHSAKEALADIDGTNQLKAGLAKLALSAYGIGIFWANIALTGENREPFYC
jgi:predicted secreted protein